MTAAEYEMTELDLAVASSLSKFEGDVVRSMQQILQHLESLVGKGAKPHSKFEWISGKSQDSLAWQTWREGFTLTLYTPTLPGIDSVACLVGRIVKKPTNGEGFRSSVRTSNMTPLIQGVAEVLRIAGYTVRFKVDESGKLMLECSYKVGDIYIEMKGF